MSAISIVRPISPIQVSSLDVPSGGGSPTANVSGRNLATPNPKEIGIFPSTASYSVVDYDLGATFGAGPTIDSLFIGFHSSLNSSQMCRFVQLSQFGGGTVLKDTGQRSLLPLFSSGPLPPFTTSLRLATPWTDARYVRAYFYLPDGSPNVQAGLFNVGLSFQPLRGFEYGSGRPVIDTGQAQRIRGGGWGIDQGAIVGGFQWTLSDIGTDELPILYALLRGAGNTSPVWVIEDPDQTAGLNERTHYGLLTKIEPYVRLDPRYTRFGLEMEEWA